MRKSRMALVSIVSAVAMLMAPSMARADTTGVIVFTAKVTLAHPLCSPHESLLFKCVPNGKKAPAAFRLRTATSNVPLAVGALVSQKKNDVQTGGSIDVTGSVDPLLGLGPWCGFSSGSGITGTISVGTKTITIDSGGWVAAVGGTITASGTAHKGAQLGTWAAIVGAAPDATKGESCLQHTNAGGPKGPGADQFFVAGAAAVSLTGSK